MKALRNFSRVFIGLIFIFSGFVKVVDPLGTAYKFTDYFVALNLDFLSGFALTFAVLMSMAELLIGIALTFNLVPKLSTWALTLFMLMFTPLTLWLAVANPISDCGCFGDAFIMTNWETFFKNVVIDIFVVIIFINRNKYTPAYNSFFQWGLGILFAISSLVLSLYCLKNLPIIDFRPYHIGANIQEGMSIPESEKDNKDIIESTFIYEKNGKKEKFTVNNIPDSTWTFVDVKHKVIKEGYKPPIHDFTIEPVYISGISPEPEQNEYVNLYDLEFVYSNNDSIKHFPIDMLPDSSWTFVEIIAPDDLALNYSLIKLTYLNPGGKEELYTIDNIPSSDYVFIDAEYEAVEKDFRLNYGQDITSNVLESDNYVFLLIMTQVENANTKNIKRLNDIAAFCKEKSYDFYCLTSSGEDKIKEFINNNNVNYNFYNTDPITLKTIIRSNPGLLLLKKGTILNKWSHKNLPEINELKDNLAASSISEHEKDNANNIVIIYILSLLLFMSLFHNFYNWMIKNKYIIK